MVAVPIFNPRPRIEHVALSNGQSCFVIDDALVEPEQQLAFAVAQRPAFRKVDFNAYPGIYLLAPDELSNGLYDFFTQHLLAAKSSTRGASCACIAAIRW